ncbi:MAG: aldo/keto reductase, partial [Planctomycetes bacterium]|nr:aldo/keto reductase [Planctomycetota bacterium]
MEKVRLGRSGLVVSRTAFGALPIQRVSFAEADSLLRAAYEGGISYFDTARGYSDSEEKIGRSLSSVRDKIVISTKVHGGDKAAVLDALETSLKNLNTDYVDLLQLHNPSSLPDPSNDQSAYAALVEAKDKGMARAVGITNHTLANAVAAAESGLYDTVQYPLSAISDEKDLRLIDVCKANDVGVIAMKALCGGLLSNARTAFAFLRQYENVVPIWGIQRRSELDEFLALEAAPPDMDEAMLAQIAKDRAELGSQFCR